MAEMKTPQGLIVGLIEQPVKAPEIEPVKAPEQEDSPAQGATADKPRRTPRKQKETE